MKHNPRPLILNPLSHSVKTRILYSKKKDVFSYMLTDFDIIYIISILLATLPFILLTFFMTHMYFKRKRIITRLHHMQYSEKCFLMNSLVNDLGYQYVCNHDIFSSTLDAWQKEFGYTALYDTHAAYFNMIFDCEPVYFDYRGQTWLIEFWKGQYGINVGGEIGIYHSDRLLRPNELKTEVFQVVEPKDELEMAMSLHYHNSNVVLSKRHWWLTVFCMGEFSHPRDIEMDILLCFPNSEMLHTFMQSMLSLGYERADLFVNGTDLFFTFNKSHSQQIGSIAKLHRKLVQLQNHLFCKLFLKITNPQQSSVDRLLYLYYQVPSIFRRTLRLCRYKRRR